MSDDYDVGYGRPPAQHRFQPGQSGNPKGRIKGAKGFTTELKNALDAPVQVTEGGSTRRISTQTAAIKRLVERALKGDQRALDKLLLYAQQLEPENATEAAPLDLADEALIEEYIRRREQAV